MLSFSSAGSDFQITDATSPELSPKSMLHVVPLRYIPVPNRHCPIRKKKNLIWPVALSTFVLNRVCELVTEEKAGVQVFRNRDLKAIVEAILKYTVREAEGDGGVRWVEKASAIMMDDDAYYAYTKTDPRDVELINKPIENYAQMKKIYTGRVPTAPRTPVVVHRTLSHLMDHKAHATRYLAMTPDGRMAWFNTFLMKYYL